MLNPILLIGMFLNFTVGFFFVTRRIHFLWGQHGSSKRTTLFLEWDHAQLYLLNSVDNVHDEVG